MSLSREKEREIYFRYNGSLEEQQDQGFFKPFLLKSEWGNHPYFKVSNSKRIKNKRRQKNGK